MRRAYGVDITNDLETIAEATLLDDGTIFIDVVQLERSPACPDCQGGGTVNSLNYDERCRSCRGTGKNRVVLRRAAVVETPE